MNEKEIGIESLAFWKKMNKLSDRMQEDEKLKAEFLENPQNVLRQEKIDTIVAFDKSEKPIYLTEYLENIDVSTRSSAANVLFNDALNPPNSNAVFVGVAHVFVFVLAVISVLGADQAIALGNISLVTNAAGFANAFTVVNVKGDGGGNPPLGGDPDGGGPFPVPDGGDPEPGGGDPEPGGGDPEPGGGDPAPDGGDPEPDDDERPTIDSVGDITAMRSRIATVSRIASSISSSTSAVSAAFSQASGIISGNGFETISGVSSVSANMEAIAVAAGNMVTNVNIPGSIIANSLTNASASSISNASASVSAGTRARASISGLDTLGVRTAVSGIAPGTSGGGAKVAGLHTQIEKPNIVVKPDIQIPNTERPTIPKPVRVAAIRGWAGSGSTSDNDDNDDDDDK